MRSAHKNLTSLLTIFLLQVALCAFCSAAAFLPRSATTTSFRPTATAQKLQVQADPSNFLFDDFRTYNGEVVDPYKILKLHRSAERSEIRTAYINLSRKYHPDVVRHKDVLPGSW